MVRTRIRRTAERPAPAKVLVVDDHPLIRQALIELLSKETDLRVVGDAAGADGLWPLLAKERPDVVLLDLTLEEGDGLDLIKAMLARYPGLRILVVSMHDEKLYAERALRAGAVGYVEKHEPPETVVRAVRQVIAGQVFLSRNMAERLLRQMVQEQQTGAAPVSPLARLSDRELQILDLLGQGLPTQTIAARLHLSAKTVQSHREHLKAKLHLESAVELVYYAIARQFAGGSESLEPPPTARRARLRVTK